MKIIVVDDNKIVRDEVCQTLKRISNIKVEKTFSNGQDAFDWIMKNEVDVVISDVQMPKMNGIELIEAINREKISVKVIFLSCYDDFEYIRAALQNRAFDYILKPLNEEDCANVINKVCLEYEKEKEKEIIDKNFIVWGREQFLYKLLTSVSIPENAKEILADLKIPFGESSFSVINVKHICDSDEYLVLLRVIEEDFKEFYNEIASYYFIEMSSTELVILCFGEIEVEETVDKMIELQNKMPPNIKSRLAFGISNPKENIDDFKEAYKEAKKAVGYTVYSNANRVIQYETVGQIKNGEISVSTVLKEIHKLIEMKNKAEIMVFVDKYLEDQSYFSETYAKSFTYCVVFSLENILNEQGYSLEIIDGIAIWDKIDNFDTIVNVRLWIYNIIKSAFDVLYKDQNATKRDIVYSIKKIIEQNYQDKLTIREISKKLHYSTKHISIVFNEIEGRSVSSYLTEFRMEKAKELLMRKDLKIYQVIEMVGYKKPDVFNKTFKAYTGYSAGEYKKLVSN